MKPFVLFTVLAGLFLLPSCEKHNRLIEEVKKIDADIKQAYAELATIDSKLVAYGGDPDMAIMTLERQNAEWVRKNASLEVELASKSKQCTEGEAAIKEFRPRVDAYKNKYSR